MPLFSGEYPSTIDDKNRVIIPAKLRQAAGPDGEAGYYVTGGIEDCIVVQTAPRFEQDAAATATERIRHTAAGRMLERARFARAEFSKCDRQGRLLIPQRLIETLNIGRDIVIVGVNDRIEIWNAERWKQILKEAEAKLQEDAERIYGKNDGK